MDHGSPYHEDDPLFDKNHALPESEGDNQTNYIESESRFDLMHNCRRPEYEIISFASIRSLIVYNCQLDNSWNVGDSFWLSMLIIDHTSKDSPINKFALGKIDIVSVSLRWKSPVLRYVKFNGHSYLLLYHH